MKQALWHELADRQAQHFSGGKTYSPSNFRLELGDLPTTASSAKPVEAEGKIRGTLLL